MYEMAHAAQITDQKKHRPFHARLPVPIWECLRQLADDTGLSMNLIIGVLIAKATPDAIFDGLPDMRRLQHDSRYRRRKRA